MSDHPAPWRPPPVREAPIESLLGRCDDVTKHWLGLLIAARSLRDVGRIGVERAATDGPALCAAVLRALGSEEALALLGADEREDRTTAVGTLLAISGVREPRALLQAVEALRATLWRELDAAGAAAQPDAGAIADRLAHACWLLASAAIATGEEMAASARPPDSKADAAAVSPRPAEPIPAPPASSGSATGRPSDEDDLRSYPRIERRGDARGVTGRAAGATRRRPAGAGGTPGEPFWELLDETPPGDGEAAQGPPAATRPGEPARVAVTPEIERHSERGSPFAILLIELVDVERLRGAEGVEGLGHLTEQVGDAMRAELEGAGRLAQEGAGRWWLVAPDSDPDDARVLAERLSAAVSGSVSHRGVPLQLAVGLATSPHDGTRPSELADHAEMDLYAARAAGLPVTPGH